MVSVGDLVGEYLPKSSTGGALPLYLLFISSLAVFNGVQTYVSPKLTRRVYSGRPAEVTPLQARLFGIWSMANAILRLYTCYNIGEKSLYDLSIISFLLAFFHFSTELFVFRTAKLGVGVLSPILASTSSLYWMLKFRSHYLGL